MCCRNSVLLSYVSPLGLGFLEQEFLRGRRRPSGSLFRNLARFGVSAAHLMHSIDVNTTPVSACTPNWNLNPQDVENWDTEGVHRKIWVYFICCTWIGLEEREDLATVIVSRSKYCVIFFLLCRRMTTQSKTTFTCHFPTLSFNGVREDFTVVTRGRRSLRHRVECLPKSCSRV